MALKVTSKPIETLIPYVNNARTHSDEQVAKIASSIKEFGFNNPILIDKDGGIIAGHGRLEAAKLLNLPQVPTICLEHLTDAQRKAYILADNRLAMDAGWDAQLLKIEFELLSESRIDLSITGFNADEIQAYMNPVQLNDGLIDADNCDGLGGDPVAKPGDVFVLGQHRLMCGNSIMIDDVDKLMKGEKADIVYTDPPYGINLETDYKKRYGNDKSSTTSQFYGEEKGIDLKSIINLSYCIEAKELFIWGADNYPDCLPRGGSWAVWDKSVESVDGIASDFELCWSRERHHYSIIRKLWKGVKAREETGQEGDHKTRWGHPTQKPIELALYFFEHWCKKSIKILDLFGGSGTTLISCEKTNRKCYMMEISPQYCDIIIRRWQKFTGHQAILESTGKPFNELAI